jgi:hypothetical protein
VCVRRLHVGVFDQALRTERRTQFVDKHRSILPCVQLYRECRARGNARETAVGGVTSLARGCSNVVVGCA